MNPEGDYPNPYDTDSAWREFNGDPENLNRHLRRRARIGPPPETVLERQFQVGVAMAEKLEGLLAIYLAFLSGVPDDPAPPGRNISDWARIQRAHIERHMHQPSRPDLPPVQLQIGARIDRFILATVDVAESLMELLLTPKRLRIQRELREKAYDRREEKIFYAQLAREEREQTAMAPPPVKASKRPKREPAPRCAKCGKRPPVDGQFCKPCAAWIARS